MATALRRDSRLLNWSVQDAQRFGRETISAEHSAADTGLFSDAALAKLIDNYPREKMQAFLSGTDLSRHEELVPVDLRGLSGAECLRAIRKGRIWFKLQRIHTQEAYGQLVRDLYGELQWDVPSFQPQRIVATLIISSPGALVYFHADAKPNVLWHMRGRKQVRCYPDGHRTLISQSDMEDIFANAIDEEVYYHPDFEKHAKTYSLNEGGFISWPQNTPHIVIAEGPLNVSISSFHETADSDRRTSIYGFNRFVRKTTGLKLSVSENSPFASAKVVGYKALRKAGVIAPHLANREYMAQWRLDADAGVRRIDPIRTEFR